MNGSQTPELDVQPRVLAIDPMPVILKGVCSYLESTPGIRVVGTAQAYDEAIQMVRTHRPHVVFLEPALVSKAGETTADIDLGLRLVQEIRANDPSVHVIVLSSMASPSLMKRAIRAGVSGYVHKSDELDGLAEVVVDLVARRAQSYFSPGAQSVLATSLTQQDGEEKNLSNLTAREREILRLVVSGRDSKQIAEECGISVRTVNTHRSRILRKSKAHSFFELIDYARDIA